MISELNAIGYCCEDIQNIENYDAAVADKSQIWLCHHKNEITLGLSSEQLIRKHLYYERPASELIFLTNSEHARLHNLNLTEERRSKQRSGCIAYYKTHDFPQYVRDKISASAKERYANGTGPWNKGRPWSEETKKRISEANKGHQQSEETKKQRQKTLKALWSDPKFKQRMIDARGPK